VEPNTLSLDPNRDQTPPTLNNKLQIGRKAGGLEEFIGSMFKVEFRQADALATVKGRENVRVWAFESTKFKEG